MIARQIVYVIQTIRCATGSPIVGVFSSREGYLGFVDKQPVAARAHLQMFELPMDVESISLLEFIAPPTEPAAEGKAPTQTA